MEKRNIIYSVILALLCAGLVVVVVLILQRRASFPASKIIETKEQLKKPPYTKPEEDYIPAKPWEPGDPTPDFPNE